MRTPTSRAFRKRTKCEGAILPRRVAVANRKAQSRAASVQVGLTRTADVLFSVLFEVPGFMQQNLIERLVLVYDANSGTWSAVVDSARKLLALDACGLCAITHGLTGERPEWTSCKEGLGVDVGELHRDELTPAMRDLTSGLLPCVVAETPAGSVVIVARDDLGACEGEPSALSDLIRERIRERGLVLPDTGTP